MCSLYAVRFNTFLSDATLISSCLWLSNEEVLKLRIGFEACETQVHIRRNITSHLQRRGCIKLHSSIDVWTFRFVYYTSLFRSELLWLSNAGNAFIALFAFSKLHFVCTLGNHSSLMLCVLTSVAFCIMLRWKKAKQIVFGVRMEF